MHRAGLYVNVSGTGCWLVKEEEEEEEREKEKEARREKRPLGRKGEKKRRGS